MPCENGTQTWKGYWYPGLITTHPTKTEDYSIRGKFKGAHPPLISNTLPPGGFPMPHLPSQNIKLCVVSLLLPFL